MGGWPLFGAPQPYRDLFKPHGRQDRQQRLRDRGAADTIGDEVAIAKEGLRRPRWSASGRSRWATRRRSVMIDLIQGKKVDDPVFTGLDECTKDTVDTCIQK